jgi:hypothetical protein
MLASVRTCAGFAAVVAALFAAASAVSCGGSKGTGSSGEPGGASGSSGSGGGAGSSGSGSGSSGGSDDDATAEEGGGSSSGGPTINTSNWTCPSATVFYGYDTECVDCLETKCVPSLNTCMTMSCQVCEGPVFDCESAMCESACSPDGGSGSGVVASGDGGGGGTATGACATLMGCCGLITMVSATEGAECTSTAAGGNEGSCQELLSMVPAEAVSLCQ